MQGGHAAAGAWWQRAHLLQQPPDPAPAHNKPIPSSSAPARRVGVQLLVQDGNVLSCYSSPWDAAFYSEVGASAAIISAGYNLDCLMLRWVGRHGWGWWHEAVVVGGEGECVGHALSHEQRHANGKATLLQVPGRGLVRSHY